MKISERTRNESFEKTQQKLGPKQQKIFDILSFYPKGLTAWDIAREIGMMIHTVRPRLTELAQIGKIVEIGTRYYEPTQRNETIWQISHTGQREFTI